MPKKNSTPRNSTRPTEAEVTILRVLWDRGPSTVREVHEALDAQKSVGYTTTLKLLQKMAAKDLVARDESNRSHVYEAKSKEEPTQRRLVADLLKNAFAGNTPSLVMRALSAKAASKEELAEIRLLLDEMERGTKK